MVLNLSVGFQNVPLSVEEKTGASEAIQKLTQFSLLLADVVVVAVSGAPEILTKISKEFSDVSYNIAGKVRFNTSKHLTFTINSLFITIGG
jgi:nucleosome binding factor SPN SPT16 subunit